MKLIAHFKSLVAQTEIAARLPYSQAVVLTAKAHPDCAAVYRAAGETRDRIQFANDRIMKRVANPNLAERRRQFQADVEAEMRQTGCEYQVAFNRVSRGSVVFANSEDLETVRTAASGSGGVPTLTPALGNVFRLPGDITPEEWRKLWAANDSQAKVINYGQLFSTACEIMQVQKGGDIEAAIEPAKARFPDLWEATAELAKLAF
jgi:hypothetical protein